jgi:threonine/homoserine/homoserine lactone efflux protein
LASISPFGSRMMQDALLTGFLTGLWLSFSFGPVFFLLIQTSVQKGIRQALFFDLGVLLSDLFYIIISFFGASVILGNEHYQDIIGIVGGLILIGFGIAPFFQKIRAAEISSEFEMPAITRKGMFGQIFKGFLVNVLNPSVLLIWFGATTVAFSAYSGSKSMVGLYFLSTLITYFGIDIAKIYLALKLKRFLNPRILQVINRISGVLIVAFGLYLVITTVISA